MSDELINTHQRLVVLQRSPEGSQLARGEAEPLVSLTANQRRSVQLGFPIAWNSPLGSRDWLIFRMGMRRRQIHAIDHPLRSVIEEPILMRLETGDDSKLAMIGCPVAAACFVAC